VHSGSCRCSSPPSWRGEQPARSKRAHTVVVWTSIVEALLVGFLPEVGRWLPGGAVNALAGTATEKGGLLPFWGAAVVLVGYGLALAVAGTRRIERREIT
jgi:ABC-2 type transport system permease protein